MVYRGVLVETHKETAHDQICIVRRSLTGDSTREPGSGTTSYLGARLLRAVLPERQLPKWQRVHGTSSAPSPSDAQTAFRSTLMNGHRQAAPAGPKSANCCRSKCAF